MPAGTAGNSNKNAEVKGELSGTLNLFWMPLESSLTPQKMAPTTSPRKMWTPSCT